MVFRADEDIPYQVMVNPTGSVEAGAHACLAKQQKLALDQLDPRAKDLAVGLDLSLSPLQSGSNCHYVFTK